MFTKYREITIPITAPTIAPPQLPLPAPPSIPKKKPKKAITPHPKAESELLLVGLYPELFDVCFGIIGSGLEVTGRAGVTGLGVTGLGGVTGRAGVTGLGVVGLGGVTGRAGATGRAGVTVVLLSLTV